MSEAIEVIHRLHRRGLVVDLHARDAEPRNEAERVDNRRASTVRLDEPLDALRQLAAEKSGREMFGTVTSRRRVRSIRRFFAVALGA